MKASAPTYNAGTHHCSWMTLTMSILPRKASLIFLLHNTCKLSGCETFGLADISRDIIIKAYFDHVYPFAPILNRADFVHSYRSGETSLFLLHAICTAASNSVPIEVIHGCGYADRSAAHTAFFSKAKLFHDFQCQGGSLSMLQGSMILGAIILDHPSDRDFQYWFHNSVRRASRLGVHNVNA